MAIDHIEDMKQQLRTAFEAGQAPWRKTWEVGFAGGPITASGKPFSGGNAAWLATVGAMRGYSSSWWFTSKQARAAGCPLPGSLFEDGAPRHHVTVCRPRIVKDREDPSKQRVIGYAWYRVYNGDLAQGWTDPVREAREIPEPDAAAARREAATGDGGRATGMASGALLLPLGGRRRGHIADSKA